MRRLWMGAMVMSMAGAVSACSGAAREDQDSLEIAEELRGPAWVSEQGVELQITNADARAFEFTLQRDGVGIERGVAHWRESKRDTAIYDVGSAEDGDACHIEFTVMRDRSTGGIYFSVYQPLYTCTAQNPSVPVEHGGWDFNGDYRRQLIPSLPGMYSGSRVLSQEPMSIASRATLEIAPLDGHTMPFSMFVVVGSHIGEIDGAAEISADLKTASYAKDGCIVSFDLQPAGGGVKVSTNDADPPGNRCGLGQNVAGAAAFDDTFKKAAVEGLDGQWVQQGGAGALLSIGTTHGRSMPIDIYAQVAMHMGSYSETAYINESGSTAMTGRSPDAECQIELRWSADKREIFLEERGQYESACGRGLNVPSFTGTYKRVPR